MDSYRNNRCGGYPVNNCRNANTRCVSTAPPNRSRCVTPNENNYNSCNKPCNKDYDMKPYERGKSGCDMSPYGRNKSDCDMKPSGRNKSDCDCDDNNKHMREMRVGIGYVPMQKWGEMYDPTTALCQGTAFPDLNLIFCGVRG